MQWVASGDSDGCITIYTYAENMLTEVTKFQAHKDGIRALAVHPTLPYLLSSPECNLIRLWDWDQGWKPCKYANSFAKLGTDGEIKVCLCLFSLVIRYRPLNRQTRP
jgi:WD40 repeat protein